MYYFNADSSNNYITEIIYKDYDLNDIVLESSYDESKRILSTTDSKLYDVGKNIIIGDNSLNIIFSSKYDDIEHRGLHVYSRNVTNIQSNKELFNTFVYNASI